MFGRVRSVLLGRVRSVLFGGVNPVKFLACKDLIDELVSKLGGSDEPLNARRRHQYSRLGRPLN